MEEPLKGMRGLDGVCAVNGVFHFGSAEFEMIAGNLSSTGVTDKCPWGDVNFQGKGVARQTHPGPAAAGWKGPQGGGC